ncbi:MAG: sigma-70 family RNA polymerase sigma factor [Candidatus Aminicenantes bacterium]|nr:sigma-70 family RNA polymerase sigma factor [Candidatus Aminicenantes bacterium]
MRTMTDHNLMTEVRDGQVEKLAILFERHHVSLFNYFLRLTGNRATSEDLVQEVFTRILKYRATYKGEDRYAVWMFKIARNAHIDLLRRQKTTLPLDEQFAEPADASAPPEDGLEREQDAALVARALARLTPRKQEILVLSRFQNMKYREIAELMECPVGTVKGTIHRAIEELGEIYSALTREKCHDLR